MNKDCPSFNIDQLNLPFPLRRKGQARDEQVRARRPVPWLIRLYIPRPPEKLS